MTGPNPSHQGRLGPDGAELRQRLANVAASIAYTEDQLAETLERMAVALPDAAMRLRAQAERARRFAVLERDQAAALSLPREPRRAVRPGPPG